MYRRVAVQQMSLNVPALNNSRPQIVIGLGECCGPFFNLWFEVTGKPLASGSLLASRGAF
jgi:hypothetical protein